MRLGHLKDVEEVSATWEGISDAWRLASSHIDSWNQSDKINIVQGEDVQILVNFDDSQPL